MKKAYKQIIIIFTVVLISSVFCFDASAEDALTYDNAHYGIVKIKLFTLSGDNFLKSISYGSGVIIDPSGFILTNYHVVTEEEDYDQSQRDVSYQICMTDEKNIEPACLYTARLIASDKDNDIALLKIRNINGLSADKFYPYLGIADNTTAINADITVLGYPTIGGDTITLTQGVVSGKTNKYNMDWIKTDADISFGNSGGAAIDNSGNIIGITTRGHSDMLGSMGYLVDIKSVESWINANKNKSERVSVLESRMIDFTVFERMLEAGNVYTKDYPAYDITRPDGWEFIHTREDMVAITNSNDEEGGAVIFYLLTFPFKANVSDLEAVFKMDNLVLLSMLDIIKSEEVSVGGKNGKKITYSVMGVVDKVYYFPHGEFVVKIEFDYGQNDKDKAIIDDIIDSLNLKEFTSSFSPVTKYSNALHNFSIDLTNSGWLGEEYLFIESPLGFYYDNNRQAYVNIRFSKRTDDTVGLTNNDLYKLKISEMKDVNNMFSTLGVDLMITDASSYANIGTNINNSIIIETLIKKGDAAILTSIVHSVYLPDRIVEVELSYFGEESSYTEVKNSFNQVMGTMALSDYQPIDISEEILTYASADDTGEKDEVVYQPPSEAVKGDNEMFTRLKGKIMLKVEDAGKAYYIHPEKKTVHYLGRPDDAFAVMREQGIGITNSNLYKIPIGTNADSGQDTDNDGLSDYLEETLGLDKSKNDSDGDGYLDGDELKNGYSPWGPGKQDLDNNFAENQAGRILLQVEKNGEAWYINPGDSKRYFLGRPADAFNAMRNLGLGITNADFASLSQ